MMMVVVVWTCRVHYQYRQACCTSSGAAYLHRAAAVLESEHRAREAVDAAAAALPPLRARRTKG